MHSWGFHPDPGKGRGAIPMRPAVGLVRMGPPQMRGTTATRCDSGCFLTQRQTIPNPGSPPLCESNSPDPSVNAEVSLKPARARGIGASGRDLWLGARQADRDREDGVLIIDGNSAIQHFGQVLCDGQPQSGTGFLGHMSAAIERIKKPMQRQSLRCDMRV